MTVGLQAASEEMEMHEVEGIYHMKLGQRKISTPGFTKALGVWSSIRQLRHSDASTTMNIYAEEIPSSVKAAVEALDQKPCGVLNTIELRLKI